MGTDLHSRVERDDGDGSWSPLEWVPMGWNPNPGPFEDRWYPMFAFLSNVRNQWGITPIAPMRGLPPGASPTLSWLEGAPGSWLTVDELAGFDYAAPLSGVEDCRSWQDFLRVEYFQDLAALVDMQAQRGRPLRVVFQFSDWFEWE